MNETDPFHKFAKRAITVPERLDDILDEQSQRSGIPKGTLARHYIINGLQAEGVQISPEDIRLIEEGIEQLRQESSQKESYDDLVGGE